MSEDSDKRLKYFDNGNVSCPICLRQFARVDVETGVVATLEHAPPASLGGRPICLTCADCNHNAGGTIDQALGDFVRNVKKFKAGRGIPVEVNAFGCWRSTGHFPGGGARAANPELAAKFAGDESLQVAMLAEFRKGPDFDINKGITIRLKGPPAKDVALGFLKAAYLMVFSFLGPAGYAFANSEAVRPIREQIMNPDEDTVLNLVYGSSPILEKSGLPSNLIVLNNRVQPFCWVVKIDSMEIDGMCVLLPHGGDYGHYRAVAVMPDQLKIDGCPWWAPVNFGDKLSVTVPLNKDSEFAGKDVFGMELMVPVDGRDHRLVVANQEGLRCTLVQRPTRVQRKAA